MAEPDSVNRAGKAPISTHPAFPAFVALWFAALLGLGCMVLPVALFERLSTATGLATLVPAAEPPLGFTARAAIALAAALAGAAAGLLLARQVARSYAPRSLARAQAPECRPISAHDELGEEGLGPSDLAPAGRKRRPLMAASERNWDESEAVIAAAELPTFPAADEDPSPETDLQVNQFGFAAAAPLAASDTEWGGFPEDVPLAPAEMDFQTQDQIMTEGQSSQPADETDTAAPNLSPVETAPPQLSVVEPKPGDTHGVLQIDERPLEELGLVQLAGRLGAAIEKRRALKTLRLASAAIAAPPSAAPAIPTGIEVAEAEDAARAIASFFGPSEAAAPAPAATLRPVQIDAGEGHEDEDEGEDEGEDAFKSFSLPLRGLAGGHGLSAGGALDDEEAFDEDETGEGEYSSLLAMKNPFSRHEEFVDGDEPELETGEFEPFDTFAAPPAEMAEAPAWPDREQASEAPHWPRAAPQNSTDSAIFAAHHEARSGPDDTERDLRAALATLQRMNGAA